jgi:hypothetical protein
MQIRLQLILLLLFVATPTFADDRGPDPRSGNFLLDFCKAAFDDKPVFDPGALMFQGWCAGSIETLVWMGRATFLPEGNRLCVPEGVTRVQAIRVVVRWLEGHPEQLHQDFQGLAWQALPETWPCGKK